MTNLWKHIVTLQGCYSAAKNCEGASRQGWLRDVSRIARQLADECDALISNIDKESK